MGRNLGKGPPQRSGCGPNRKHLSKSLWWTGEVLMTPQRPIGGPLGQPIDGCVMRSFAIWVVSLEPWEIQFPIPIATCCLGSSESNDCGPAHLYPPEL